MKEANENKFAVRSRLLGFSCQSNKSLAGRDKLEKLIITTIKRVLNQSRRVVQTRSRNVKIQPAVPGPYFVKIADRLDNELLIVHTITVPLLQTGSGSYRNAGNIQTFPTVFGSDSDESAGK